MTDGLTQSGFRNRMQQATRLAVAIDGDAFNSCLKIEMSFHRLLIGLVPCIRLSFMQRRYGFSRNPLLPAHTKVLSIFGRDYDISAERRLGFNGFCKGRLTPIDIVGVN
jgi:hypothetical protein